MTFLFTNLTNGTTSLPHLANLELQLKVLYSYRLVPSFGKTIRRFSLNVSEMKKKAARDYEDLLQVKC